jgi:monoamine oxidase
LQGFENVREGNVHFCGEATEMEFEGYMEGAVRAAERLAERLALNWPKL